ncbi:c-type cytochrome [Capnocytophaga sp.]|uniref:c-type cytochrome n=1 Tax=Capnocytophaga sp. TaxID=44737 RepID=UPI0026DD66F6|nr:c-type cytochrome [Capnocytophaga sp.]MDO5104499.1 c-type cytochrome [Capnocytophaga sp.]MDO5106385.1 c-type cytochrome [Capnocytophaga sp.]
MKKVKNHNSLIVSFFGYLLLALFSSPTFAQGDPVKGETLFKTNCMACHQLDKRAVGPALGGVTERRENEWLHKWINNSAALIASGDADAKAIFEEFNQVPMAPYEGILSHQDIEDILAYTANPPAVQEEPAEEEVPVILENPEVAKERSVTYVTTIIGVVVLLIALFVVMFLLGNASRIVASGGITAEEFAKRKEGLLTKAFVENPFLVLTAVSVLLFGSTYAIFGYLMQIDVNQGYEPIQPIHFSHKIHAGDNQIDCKLCHSAARVSKTAGIPSLNVCMNCHETISEYKGVQDVANGYTREFYTNEIKKLYEAVGWDEKTFKYTGETKPVRWVRIHNLPDFAYFNHSQHVTVAGLECQQCHGKVEEMEIVHQHAPLTMGWCVDCHRQTEVNVDNGYYQNYKEVHAELAKKLNVEKLTIAQLGGLECGKCHY